LQSGFTMNELIVVLVLVGVTSVFILPKLQASLGMRDGAWRDEVLASMRYAQKSAVAHRRLVCASVAGTAITLTIATVNPAVACNASLKGLDGGATFASTGNSSAGTAVSPVGTIYFQPDGRVTSDGAGTTSSTRTISMEGADDVTVNGETGHVQ
jgi:prepilin-type N-terminal cleavage/methylation domain-containing protein